MTISCRLTPIAILFFAAINVQANASDFSGSWTIDLRNPEEKARKAECGSAGFELRQNGNRVTGSHYMATVDCGQVNEGSAGTVQGSVSGNQAVLLVTSNRNGAVVKGVATLKNGTLYWEVEEEVKVGDPSGDDLILFQGVLKR